jgi:hypothetical protein
MATVLGAIAAVAVLWLMLGLLARPAGNDKRARDVSSPALQVPRQRTSSPAPARTPAAGFRSPTPAPATPAAPVRATGSRPATELVALLQGEVSPAEMHRVLSVASAHQLPAELLKRWAERFDVQRMILVVDAGVGESALRRHLRDKTQPDWAALRVFADLAQVKARIAAAEPARAEAR